MKLVRKQVYITEAQDQLLKRAARREQRAEAEILRAALDQALRPKKIARPGAGRDPLWDIVGVGRSDAGDVALDVDRYLYGISRT
jgi:hypothetical protein